MPQTLDEVFSFFESRTNLERGLALGNINRTYRLDRMETLCRAYGNPQNHLPVIHLAGSKGKGSTAAFTAALLSGGGNLVGIYASPHLSDYRERFSIHGLAFPERIALETGLDLIKRLPDAERKMPGHGNTTTFELLTLFAFLFFKRAGCTILVLETGLGGRLDATNVVTSPRGIVFTHIEYEHAEILGPSLEDIALEKAGIMKSGCPLCSAAQNPGVRKVLNKEALKHSTEIRYMDDCLAEIKPAPASGKALFSWNLHWKNRPVETISLGMGGRIQAENAALALMTVRQIKSSAFRIPSLSLQTLPSVVLPGRFEIICREPLVVLDGSHTPDSIAAVTEAFSFLVEGRTDSVLLFGCAENKNYAEMARILLSANLFSDIVVSAPSVFRPGNPHATAKAFSGTHRDVVPCPVEAWHTVRERAGKNRPILITGSFYMAGEVLQTIRANK